MDIQQQLKKITSQWFLTEPLLFSTVCTHTLVENNSMSVPMRTGRMRIEYSPLVLQNCNAQQLEDYLKVEVFRILLQHPYKRQPYNAKRGVLTLASDVTINSFFKTGGHEGYAGYGVLLPGVEYCKSQAIRFTTLEHPLGIKWHLLDEEKFFQRNMHINPKNGYLEPVDDLSFEQWYKWLLFLITETAIAGSENAGSAEGNQDKYSQPNLEELSELWEENEEAQKDIKDQIKKAEKDQGWGELGGGAIIKIKDECDFSFDYRKALTQFRANIVSASRSLTRMKPSRRYGFKAMGSRYERKANILVAVDVSGSITEESFEHFYHAIKNFFFLGIIEKIDLIFFDVNLKNTTPVTFRKKIDLEQIKGRGGTNFQPAIDFYFNHNDIYNGMIIFTDGEGPIPQFAGRKGNVLWILEGRLAFEKSRKWIDTLPGCKSTYLPF